MENVTMHPMAHARIPYRVCPLCNSDSLEPGVSADCSQHPLYKPILPALMHWKRCASCAHIFTEGYFTPEAASIVFSNVNPHQMVGHNLEQQRCVSARMIEKVLPLVDQGDWLDVGFGNASLLFTAREYGFTPVGIDLRAENVRQLLAQGIEAHALDLSELPHVGRYRVISMADVLEHVPFPKDTLRSASRLLVDEGYLFLSMPNSESMVWLDLDSRAANPYWGELEHYHNFSRSRLYALLRECHFEPIRYGISERYRACMEVVARKLPAGAATNG
jgi:SAM-dependent methyltransferase